MKLSRQIDQIMAFNGVRTKGMACGQPRIKTRSPLISIFSSFTSLVEGDSKTLKSHTDAFSVALIPIDDKSNTSKAESLQAIIDL